MTCGEGNCRRTFHAVISRIEIFIGLGSNLGNREASLALARTALISEVGEVVRQSAIVETEPVGMDAGTPEFLNQVVGVRIMGDAQPQEIMSALLEIESVLGRKRIEGGFSSRTIDLDLLLWPGMECALPAAGEAPELTLPHPRLMQRLFSLGPLAEIAPEIQIPGASMSVEEAYEKLTQSR